MKRFCLIVAGSAFAPAFAQSVAVYGLIDVGVSRVSGLRGGPITQVVSGVMDGSRWGLRADEDLGSGYKVISVLESRMEFDTGALTNRPVTGTQLPDRLSTPTALGLPDTPANRAAVTAIGASIATASLGVNIPGRLFDRQAYVGISMPYGSVLAGRQYTPAYEVVAAFDATNTSSALSAGQVSAYPATIDIRVSNSLLYKRSIGGWTVKGMWAAGEGDQTTGRLLGGMASYQGAGLALGLGYNTRENELGQKSLTSSIMGGNIEFGPGTFSAFYSCFKDDHPSGLSAIPSPFRDAFVDAVRQDGSILNVGYKYKFGQSAVTVAFTSLNDKSYSNADVQSYGAVYTYSLSKRTDVSAVAVRVKNSQFGQSAPGGAGYLGGFSSLPGVDVSSLSLSVRHRF